jgi:hypothetical protein
VPENPRHSPTSVFLENPVIQERLRGATRGSLGPRAQATGLRPQRAGAGTEIGHRGRREAPRRCRQEPHGSFGPLRGPMAATASGTLRRSLARSASADGVQVKRARGRRRRRSPTNCGRDELRRGVRPGPGPFSSTTRTARKSAQGFGVAKFSSSCSSELGERGSRRQTTPCAAATSRGMSSERVSKR